MPVKLWAECGVESMVGTIFVYPLLYQTIPPQKEEFS